MNAASLLVTKRKIGNGWGFGRAAQEDDITPLEAASFALHVYDGSRRREPFQPIMAS
jgi:hypothetical protein